jgi:hypothetical protein
MLTGETARKSPNRLPGAFKSRNSRRPANDRLENFLLARALSLRSRRIIHQNIAIALGTVVVMTCAAFLFPISLAIGVACPRGQHRSRRLE